MFEFSQSYWAKIKRIQRLPKLFIGVMESKMKKDATNLITEFQDGIRTNSFRLHKLKDGTIERKRQLGMERPKAPLYGKGDSEKDNSYINMLRIRKLKNGYRVRPSIAKHYNGKVKLRTLFYVHEFGTIIKSRGEGMIKIEPRPAFKKAFNRVMRKRRMQENTDMVSNAMLSYVRTANLTTLGQIDKQYKEGLAKFNEE